MTDTGTAGARLDAAIAAATTALAGLRATSWLSDSRGRRSRQRQGR